MRRHLAALLAATALLAGPATAARLDAQRVVDVQRVAELVRERHGGRILAVGEALRDGRPGYRVKLLGADGVVRVLWIEAGTPPAGRP